VTPVRSCVGCGQRGPQASLIRMTWRDGGLVRDGGRRGTGRGGYLHDAPACWQTFVGRRGPVRSLRAAVSRPVREAFVRELQAETCGGKA
jgi:predicted RNA-binding protein YlxR (DUF448 family)